MVAIWTTSVSEAYSVYCWRCLRISVIMMSRLGYVLLFLGACNSVWTLQYSERTVHPEAKSPSIHFVARSNTYCKCSSIKMVHWCRERQKKLTSRTLFTSCTAFQSSSEMVNLREKWFVLESVWNIPFVIFKTQNKQSKNKVRLWEIPQTKDIRIDYLMSGCCTPSAISLGIPSDTPSMNNTIKPLCFCACVEPVSTQWAWTYQWYNLIALEIRS